MDNSDSIEFTFLPFYLFSKVKSKKGKKVKSKELEN